jgi:sarcosine oxidase, subunit gamma
MTLHRESPPYARTAAAGAAGLPAWRDTVALADVSLLDKAGLKGPGAAAWLRDRGLPVPQSYNTWSPLPGGGLIARLAVSEFFIEDAAGGSTAAGIAHDLESPVAGVWPVLRQDAGMVLAGARAGELLVQTCSFNFAGLAVNDGTVVMTSMAGVSLLAVRSRLGEMPCYRLWCDPTFAPYLWGTLVAIVHELDGGVIDVQTLAARIAS